MSNPIDRAAEVNELLARALEIPEESRGDFLAEVCGDDRELQVLVERLLSASAQPDDLLETGGALKLAAIPGLVLRDADSEPATAWVKPGQTLAHYRILARLGAGGMGEVFLAEDERLKRRAALKVLPPELAENREWLERFQREAETVASLNHPNVITIYSIENANGLHFLTMEMVDGPSLRELLDDSAPLSFEHVLDLAIQISEGLAVAHSAGIVHRDLKPGNVMIAPTDRAKLMDFGLARSDPALGAGSKTDLTREGAILGTIAYMSPEQLMGHRVDPRSDIFSLGILLFELASGKHPFRAKAEAEASTLAKILEHEPDALLEARAGLPRELERIIRRCLEKEPANRYQDTAQVVRELSDLRGGEKSALPLARDLPGARSVFDRGRRRALAGVAALVVTLAAFWLWLPSLSRQPRLLVEEPLSIAVLPLHNISQDPEESDYLAEGIGQAVTTRLTQAGLRVAPWERVLRVPRDQSFKETADELGVEAVLMGRFELADDRIRATLAVVEVANGSRAWTQDFDEPFEDLLVIQRQIALEAGESLKGQLTSQEQETLTAQVSDNLDAYDYYLQGAHFLHAEDQESVAAAREYFERSLEIDPELVEAHIGLGAAHSMRYFNSWGGMDELRVAEQSYLAALRLEPASMRARRGLIKTETERGRWQEVLIQAREARRAGRPDDVETLFAEAEGYAMGGLPKLSLPIFRRILEIDPLNHGAAWWLAVIATWAGEFEAAVHAGEAYLGKFGDDGILHINVGISYYALLQKDQAEGHYQKAMAGPTDLASLNSQLYRGHLQHESGRVDAAHATWTAGLEALRRRPEVVLDSPRLKFLEATFETCLDRAPSREALSDMLNQSPFNSTETAFLAAALARQGDWQRSVELLRLMLDRGALFHPTWRGHFTGFGLDPDSPRLDGIKQDLETRADEMKARFVTD